MCDNITYRCSNKFCERSYSGRATFDCIGRCVVGVRMKDESVKMVEGVYSGHGFVIIRVGSANVVIYLTQFKIFFDYWGEIEFTADEVYCCESTNIKQSKINSVEELEVCKVESWKEVVKGKCQGEKNIGEPCKIEVKWGDYCWYHKIDNKIQKEYIWNKGDFEFIKY